MSRKTTSKTLWLILVVSCFIILGVYSIFTHLDYRQLEINLEDTLAFVNERIDQCENLNTNDRVKSLVRLVDKTKELSRVIQEEDGLNTQTLEDYCLNQNIDGVIVLDENLDLVLSYQNIDVSWKEMVGINSISDIPFHNKEYSIRVQENGKIYDFAATPRQDAPGVVLTFKQKDLLQAIAQEDYFKNYTFKMDALVVMSENGVIVSSNNDDLTLLTSKQVGKKYGVVFESARGFLKVSTVDGKYYGKKYEIKEYTIYILCQQSTVFKSRTLAIWLSTILIVVLWGVLSLIRISMEREKERENKEELQNAVEEAQRANAAKTNFLRRMSHDLRTPINGINGMVEISRHYAGDEEKQEECRQKITSASDFLLDLVNNVLDMSKLESGQIKLEEKALNLEKLIQDTNSVIQVQALEKGIQFKEHFEIKHKHVLGSPLHIRQIIQNIENNAIKYTQNGGKVETFYREIFVDKKTICFEFICSDNGIGMGKEFQEKAFEPFSQEFSDARTSYEGSGLGLSISNELVKYMHGSIKLESELNEGTKFIIKIPLKIDDSYVEIEESEKSVKTDLKGIHVLLVEDNEMNMEIAQFLLEKNGVKITCAWNGQEAIDVFTKSEIGEFDVILMDIMMPLKDGLQATREIRKLNRGEARFIPIIAMSANVFEEDIQKAMNAGMNGYLTKPLDVNKLLVALEKYQN